ncbi:MAG TPA: hypothetical protein VGL10_06335, partial [Gammaproteobacteria bacterium]
RYAYYSRLSRKQQEIYRRSDAIEAVPVEQTAELLPDLQKLSRALGAGDRARTQQIAAALVRALAERLGARPVAVKVLSKRPSNDWGELHGLYDPETAVISVWMRTAQRKQVVAFKTFLRTLLHELCHHLDYACFKLEDSFHTEGFYKRESSIYKQLMQVMEAGNLNVPRP